MTIEQENQTGAVTIGRISYINVSPVYYGLDRSLKPHWLSMVTEPPAVLNRMLENREIVMSPVSSAAYAKNHDQWLLMPDVSISSFGKVMSVILASHYSLDDLHGKRIIFSEESATAANLVRYILARRKIRPVIETRKITDADAMAKNVDAALVIGDAALIQNWEESFEHVFDLGEIWNEMTGLPFVYAVWAIRKDYARACPQTLTHLKKLFYESKRLGEGHKDEIAAQASLKTGLTHELCMDYFRHLDCDFGPLHRKGLETFFQGLYETGLLSEKVRIEVA